MAPTITAAKRHAGRAGKGAAAAIMLAGAACVLAIAWHGGVPGAAGNDAAPVNQALPLDAGALRDLAQLPLVVARLRERVQKAPADADGWALLARTYARLGEHANASGAFEHAVQLRAGDAALLADYADTLAFLNNRSFEGKPQEMIDRALRADPHHPAALMLAGLAAFDRQDYAGAIAQWDSAASAAGAGSPIATQAAQGIGEARRRAGAM